MMTTPKSGRYTLLRLAGTLPVVTGLLCAFSFTTRAAEIRIPETEKSPADTVRAEETRHIRVAVTRDGKPLAGAIVLIAGTHRGTVTDKDGNAGIDAAPGATLVVTYVGCESQKIVIPPAETGPETIRVAMEMRENELVPISITPGDKNNEPLCIVDGAEYPNIHDLDKETIARIDVLKNESAIASYGARGQNGVIIVTTKKAAAASDLRDEKTASVSPETMPSFRGGNLLSFRQWVQERIEYPQDALRDGVQGRVILSAVIRADGTLTDIEVSQSPDPRLSAEAVRIVESSPANAWTPALKEGKPIDRKIHVPVEFRLPGFDADQPFVIVEKMPTFRNGSLDTFRKWVQMQVRYPAGAMKNNIQGRVITSFVIERDGSISNIQVLQAPDKLLADEARRVIETSPAGAWSPGRQRGQAVRVKFTIPVDFLIQSEDGKLPERDEKPAGSLDGVVVVGYGSPVK